MASSVASATAKVAGTAGAKELAHALFANKKYVLAPMVRCGTIPFRLTCLHYGADTVFGPEIIDKKLIQCYREENPRLGTVDFKMRSGALVFRTKPSVERGKLIFQLGSSSPELAVAGAKLIAGDVDGIDLNMGCPKSFSIKGGMGAALLKTPTVACEIIKALRANFPDKAVSCKIRLLGTTDETVRLCQSLEAAGAHAISIHARTKEMRPRDPAHWEHLVPLVKSVNIPILANGDVFSRDDADTVMRSTGVSSVMIARGALLNASMFKPDGNTVHYDDVCRQFVRFAVETDAHPINAKYILQYIYRENNCLGDERGRALTSKATRDLRTIASLWGLQDELDFSNVTLQYMGKKRGRKNNTQERPPGGGAAAAAPLDQKYSDDFHVKQGGSDIPAMKRKKLN
jgi:tRNA-dihydrouridine synthase 2